ncbi:virus ReqiPepy6 Gp37-like protein [Amycolatopsis pretoriensis]|uniref:Virus ReqiPepy6 Gp37-like protein n=1 Tax=Amycolatopsis pretoriensis TaxID=218821 RepID=A0A1H5R8L4_9PSEU|nr:siphovirus ReqiPepy6 Gp37-like family protein [Amycolatopsis pretoriensis]SEF34414.1 virus ReqiPepy6 Gp37-like protein [Amycolatopsis pretoriensis]
MTFEWRLYVRDANYQRQGEIRDYTSATLSPVYNDVGTWSITLDRNSPMAPYLTTPGWGIIATRNDVALFTGITTNIRHVVGATDNHMEISGSTDEIWLQSRLVSPSPGESSAPYTVQAVDVRTGPASTVLIGYVNANLGPGAVTTRRKAGFTVGADPVIGASVRGEGRWDADLLTFIQPMAQTANVGFRVVQVGAGLQFQVFAPTDRSSTVKFSVALGNLSAFEYSSSRPRANYVFVGASGTGTARIIKEFADGPAIATWERIEGPLANQGTTSDSTAIAQAGADALAQNSEQASLTITPLEKPNLMYGVHYALGDIVTVQLEGPAQTPYTESGQIVDLLRQVTITLSKDEQTITPTIGTPAKGTIPRLIRAFQQQARRINNLERT